MLTILSSIEELSSGVLYQRRKLTHVTLHLKPINNRQRLRKSLGVSYSIPKNSSKKSSNSSSVRGGQERKISVK
jgi:hypothetical protein